jgi:choline-sulfatase
MSAALGGAVRRVVAATSGAVAASLVAASFDAQRTAELGDTAFGPAWLTAAGLLLPVGLTLGFGVGVVLAVVTSAASRRRIRDWFAPEDSAERRERAWLLALGPPAFTVWLLFVAGTALRVLISESEPEPLAAGLALGLSVLGVTLALVVFGLARALAQRLGFTLSPAKALFSSLAVSAAAFSLIVVSGEPSGAGGPFSLFGVLLRDELDLRPVLLLGLIGAGALLTPAPRSRVAAFALSLAALLPPPLLLSLADQRLSEPKLSLAIERSSPLSGKLLGQLRKRSDRDRDGHSARFGGGDCDDRDPKLNPGADDLPNNGVDEDCSGRDAQAARAPVAAPAQTASAARASAPAGLNVVLVTIDTLRYDLGYMGTATRPISPRIDELSRESVVFERAYSLASYTSKSLPPMLIGKYCSETHRGYSHFNRFEKADTFVAERLTAAGLDTVSVQGHWYFFQKYGMERGFARIDSSAQPKAAQAEGDRTSTSEKLTDVALAELARPELGAKPFFLWVHYTDPHAEYVPHEGFDFGSDSRARYDGEVAYVDHHVGRLLDGLRKGPHWSKTAVVLTSDHGEAFGEHGMIRHGFELWEELVRVPLLVRVPGVAARRVTTRRSLIDLVPTLLDLYRLPAPAERAFSGTSLLPDLVGEGAPPRPILVDMPQGPHNAERSAYIDGDLKLVTGGGRPLGLYDLSRDPAEKHNLLDERERVRSTLDAYKAFRRTLREVYVRPTP